MCDLIMTITDIGVSQRGAPQPQLCCPQRPTRCHPPSLLPAPHSSCRPRGAEEGVDFLCSLVPWATAQSSSESFGKVLIRQVMTDVPAARGKKLQKCHPGLVGPRAPVPRARLKARMGLPLTRLCFSFLLCSVSSGGALKVI